MLDVSNTAVLAPRKSRARQRVEPLAQKKALFLPGARRIFGHLRETGVAVWWHDFETGESLEFPPHGTGNRLHLCLNVSGASCLRHGKNSLSLDSSMAGFYIATPSAPKMVRAAGARHRFLLIEFSRDFLREHLSQSDGALHRVVEQFLAGEIRAPRLGAARRLSVPQEQRIALLLQPPFDQAGHSLWHRGQVFQWMVEFLFRPGGEEELFCDRQKHLARERVEKTIALLTSRLAAPPALEEIGRAVGCSPFYLSRTFSREVGMTIPQYLRKIRMERAAELLRNGKHNVTEVALEVGYSSLSHFSQAFCQTTGCCPGLYPAKIPFR